MNKGVAALTEATAQLDRQKNQWQHDQQLWATALREHLVTAWVEGNTVTISGPPGTTVPVTVPARTTAGAGRPAFARPYAGELSGYTTLGSRPLTLTLGSAPFGG